MEEPRVFIGCSSEALPIAEFLQSQLQHVATAQIWNQGFFKGGDYTLERLLQGVSEFDFAIFIVSPDDLADIRGSKYLIARDNVLFEGGLFFSQLGRKRTLLVAPYKTGTQEVDFHLPSDLSGLNLVKYYPYASPKDLPARIGPVASEIKGIIEFEGKLIDQKIKRIVDSHAITGGILSLLKHLDIHRSSKLNECIGSMLIYNSISHPKSNNGWEMATRYAAQTLMAFELAEFAHTTDLGYQITDFGRSFLRNPLVIAKYIEIMQKPFYRKKQ